MSERETLHTPFRKLYQELRCWTREHTEETITSPSNVKIQEWQEEVNRQRKLWDEGDVARGIAPKTQGISPERLAAKNEEWRKARESGNN